MWLDVGIYCATCDEQSILFDGMVKIRLNVMQMGCLGLKNPEMKSRRDCWDVYSVLVTMKIKLREKKWAIEIIQFGM